MGINSRKVVVVGCGFVGSSSAFALMQSQLFSEMVLIDADQKRAEGEAIDISHGMVFASPMKIYAGTYDDISDAAVIVITAGANQKPDETRLDLIKKNSRIMKSIVGEIKKREFEGILLIVSNPVDILTYIAQKEFNYPRNLLIGTGTLLDTARFNKMLADLCGVDAKNVTGFVLGEHGGTSFIPWNAVNIVGIPFHDFQKQFGLKEPIDCEKLLYEVKVSGLDIVELKGYTSSGIALSVCRLVGAIMRNERAVVPASVVLEGEYGLEGIAMSLPCVISRNGVERTLQIPLDKEGEKNLKICYEYLRNVIKSIS